MRKAVLLLSLILSSAASAGEVFIPVAFRGPGANGTLWRTEITVSNISSPPQLAPVPTTITLHRNDNLPPLSLTTPLAMNETLTVPDAIWDWFGLEGGAGVVRVTWAASDAKITARARIYNVTDDGEFGQGVPGVRPETLVSEQFLTGLSGVNGNRTNVGVSNPFNHHTLFWIELFDTSGLSRGSFATSVPPYSFRQFNDIFSYFQAGPLYAATIRISGTDGVLYAYASVVRNDTGDATFVTPAQ